MIVKKRQRRLSDVDEIVLSLYAKGLTTGEISSRFEQIYGANAHGPKASAHPHTQDRSARQQPASEQRTFDRDRIGIYHQHWVHSEHRVTTLLLAKV